MTNLNNFLTRQLQAITNSLGQFTRTPMASLMTCLVIGITLTLPIVLFVALKNIESMSHSFQQSTQVTLFLKKNTSEAEATALSQKLQNNKSIIKVYTISPEEGLSELQQQAGFQGALDELHDNPLPWAVVVIPNTTNETPEAIDKLTQSFKQLPEVDTIQTDMLWVKRLGTLISLGKRLVFSLALFLSIAVLLIVNNTIRSATQNNQKEIEIIKLVGGTNSFIRRPFLYAGILYGLLGGIIAWQAVDVLLLIARSPTHQLANLYNNSFDLVGLGFVETVILLSFSMGLGLAGSWLAVTRHLRSHN